MLRTSSRHGGFAAFLSLLLLTISFLSHFSNAAIISETLTLKTPSVPSARIPRGDTVQYALSTIGASAGADLQFLYTSFSLEEPTFTAGFSNACSGYTSTPSIAHKIWGDVPNIRIPSSANWQQQATVYACFTCPPNGMDDFCAIGMVAQQVYSPTTTNSQGHHLLSTHQPAMGIAASSGSGTPQRSQLYSLRMLGNVSLDVALSLTVLTGAVSVRIRAVNLTTGTGLDTWNGASPAPNWSYSAYRSGDAIFIGANASARATAGDLLILVAPRTAASGSTTATWSITNQFVGNDDFARPMYIQDSIPMTTLVAGSGSWFSYDTSKHQYLISRRQCPVVFTVTATSLAYYYGFADVFNTSCSGIPISWDTWADDYGITPGYSLEQVQAARLCIWNLAYLNNYAWQSVFQITISANCSRTDTGEVPSQFSTMSVEEENPDAPRLVYSEEDAAALVAARISSYPELIQPKQSEMTSYDEVSDFMQQNEEADHEKTKQFNPLPSEPSSANGTILNLDTLYQELRPTVPAEDLAAIGIKSEEELEAMKELFSPKKKDSESMTLIMGNADETTEGSSSRHLLSLAEHKVPLQNVMQLTGLFDGTNAFEEIVLRTGQLQKLFLPGHNSWVRLTYRPNNFNQDIVFQLNRESGGDPDIYITKQTNVNNLAYSALTLPSDSSFLWSGREYLSDQVTIQSIDTNRCTSNTCVYHIWVLGLYRAVHASLNVYEGDGVNQMFPGYSYRIPLTANRREYFSFDVSATEQQVQFVLTNVQGTAKPTMYVSESNENPGPWPNNDWNGTVPSTSSFTTITLDPPSSSGDMRKYTCTPSRVRVCTFYLGLASTVSTQVTIMATSGGLTTLIPGQYQDGRLFGQATASYRFQVSKGYGIASFSLAQQSWYGTMYISNNISQEIVPSRRDTWTSYLGYTSVFRALSIAEGTSQACPMGTADGSTCWYRILIVPISVTRFDYSILGSVGTNQVSFPIPFAQPVEMTLQPNTSVGNVTYFYMRVETRQTGYLSFTVLQGALTIIGPSSSIYPTGTGALSDPLHNWANLYIPPGDWHFAVVNRVSRISTFSVMAWANDRGDPEDIVFQTLTVGRPQYGRLDYTMTTMYYTFRVFSTRPLLTVNLFVQSGGETDLYITYSSGANPPAPAPENAMWWSNRTGSDAAFIRNAVAGTYAIAVRKRAPFAAPPAFIISVSDTTEPTALISGIPTPGWVLNDQFSYYVITVPSSPLSLVVSLTTLSGDADLVIRCQGSGTAVLPNMTYYTWRSMNGGLLKDTIEIPSSDPRRCAQNANYYIGVYGWVSYPASSFSIVATVSTGSGAIVSVLAHGVPQSRALSANDVAYYQYTPRNATNNIDISLAVVSGMIRVWVSNQTPRPSSTNYVEAWYASSNVARTIYNYSWRPTCPGITNANLTSCLWFFAVEPYPTTTNASYSITASSAGSSTLLTAQQPRQSTLLPGATDFYYALNYYNNMTLTFALTAFGGNPDIYISQLTDAPGPTNYQWSSASSGDDVIVFRNSNPGFYYVGIYGQSESNSSYSLIWTYQNPSTPGSGALFLYQGTPQNDAVLAGGWKWYYFYVGTGWEQITLSLTRRSGDPDIFVNSATLDGWTWPSRDTARWSSSTVGDDELLLTEVPGYSYLLIGIYGKPDTPFAGYTLAVTPLGQIQTLLPGSALTASVSQGAYNYYRFQLMNVYANADLAFILTPTSGNPDLYLSVSTGRPSTTNYNLTSANSDIRDILIIRHSAKWPNGDPMIRQGYYYIAVYGTAASAYSIVASYETRIQLRSGTQQYVYMQSNDLQYFSFDTSPGESFFVYYNGYSGYPSLYIAKCPTVSDCPLPSPTDPLNSFLAYDTSNTTLVKNLVIPGAVCQGTVNCRYTIMTFAPIGWAYGYITATYMNASQALVRGVALRGQTVAYHQYQYYTFQVLNPQTKVTVTLTPTSGDPDLYILKQISTTTPFPVDLGNSSLQWSARYGGISTDMIVFDETDFRFQPTGAYGRTGIVGTYFVSVYGYFASAYSILYEAVSGEDITFTTLYESTPQLSVVSADAYKYYQFSVSIEGKISFALSSLESADADIYVSVGAMVAPSKDKYDWRSEAPAETLDLVTIEANDPKACHITELNPICVYSVSVYGFPGSPNNNVPYMITASQTDSTNGIAILPGQPNNIVTQNNVPYGQSTYYMIPVLDTDRFQIISEACSGATNLFYSKDASIRKPNINSNTAASTETEALNVISTADRLTNTIIFISIASVDPKVPATSNLYFCRNCTYATRRPSITQRTLTASPLTADGSLTLTFARATAPTEWPIPCTGSCPRSLIYSFYATHNSNVMYSKCGMAGSDLLKKLTDSELEGYANADGNFDVNLVGLNPSSSYTINILVEAIQGDTAAPMSWSAYTMVNVVGHGDDSSSSSSTSNTLLIVFLVGLPIVAALVGVVVYLFFKNKRLSDELSVEMNEMSPHGKSTKSGLPSIRSPNMGAFTRGGGQNFNRLMDEEAGSYRPPSRVNPL